MMKISKPIISFLLYVCLCLFFYVYIGPFRGDNIFKFDVTKSTYPLRIIMYIFLI